MSECAEHDRCIQRDKAECEWCQNPAVVQDAQRYNWRTDMDALNADAGLVGKHSTQFNAIRIYAYIERLEAERDALLAEHEAWTAWRTGEPSTSRKDWNRLTNAHDNAERVIRGE